MMFELLKNASWTWTAGEQPYWDIQTPVGLFRLKHTSQHLHLLAFRHRVISETFAHIALDSFWDTIWTLPYSNSTDQAALLDVFDQAFGPTSHTIMTLFHHVMVGWCEHHGFERAAREGFRVDHLSFEPNFVALMLKDHDVFLQHTRHATLLVPKNDPLLALVHQCYTVRDGRLRSYGPFQPCFFPPHQWTLHDKLALKSAQIEGLSLGTYWQTIPPVFRQDRF